MNKKSSVGKNAFNTFQYPFFGIDILASLFSGQLFCESDAAALNFDHRFWLQFDNLTFIMIPGADNVQTRQPGRPHTWAPPASHQPGHVSGTGEKNETDIITMRRRGWSDNVRLTLNVCQCVEIAGDQALSVGVSSPDQCPPSAGAEMNRVKTSLRPGEAINKLIIWSTMENQIISQINMSRLSVSAIHVKAGSCVLNAVANAKIRKRYF